MSSEPLESINCKVVLLGETGVGKTCLIERYTKSEFHDNFAPTLGGTFIEKEVAYKSYNKTIKFQIWDTAGQEKYRSINKLFYSDANIAILVYDITRKETFDEIKNYMQSISDIREQIVKRAKSLESKFNKILNDKNEHENESTTNINTCKDILKYIQSINQNISNMDKL